MRFCFSWDEQLAIKLEQIEARRSALQTQYAVLLAQLNELEQYRRQAYRECDEQRCTAHKQIEEYLEENRWADRPYRPQKEAASCV